MKNTIDTTKIDSFITSINTYEIFKNHQDVINYFQKDNKETDKNNTTNYIKYFLNCINEYNYCENLDEINDD
jgi:hypothetical protein